MITAVFITKDEEKNISQSLDAIAKVADEIIVVDHGSQDATIEIAKSKGAIVHQKEWTGYSDGKNFGNAKAKNDWILSIDADEILTDELIDSIKALVLDDKEAVYALDRANYFGDKWVRYCGWYPDWKIRLFHRDTAKWEGDFVHERLRFNVKVKVKELEGRLRHNSYAGDEDHWQRIEKYALLGAEKLIDAGKRPSKLKQFFSPMFRFLRTYILKFGFLDGALGWKISLRNAAMVIKKYEAYNRLLKEKKA